MRAVNTGLRPSFKSQLLVGAAGIAAVASPTAAFADGAAPPADAPKWAPFFELSAASDDSKGLGGVNFFLPVKQDLDSLLFARVGVQTRFKSDNIENFSLGYRKKNGDGWIFGGYAGVDHAKTEFGQDYVQFSAGLEAMSVDWDFHINGYLADRKVNPLGVYKLDIHDTFIGIKQQQEATLSGFDGEVGYRVFRDGNTDVRLYAGGFVFDTPSKFIGKSMNGPKGGAQVDLYDLDAIGPQSRITFNAEVSDDDVRGTTGFFGVALRIPTGFIAGSGAAAQTLDELDRRMVDSPRRHDGIYSTTAFNKSEPVIIYNNNIRSQPTNTLFYVDNTAGGGSYADPTTLTDATARTGPNQFIVLTDNDGPAVHSGGATLRSGETLVGPNTTFSIVGTESGALFTHTFAPGSGPVVLDNPGGNVLNVQSNTNISGVNFGGSFVNAIYGHNVSGVVINSVDIDGSGGGVNGILLVQDAGFGSVTVVNSSIHDVSGDGIHADVTGTGPGIVGLDLQFVNSTANNSGDDGIEVLSDASGGASVLSVLGIHNSTISGSGDVDAIMVGTAAAGSTVTQSLVVDPTFIYGGDYGIIVEAIANGGSVTQNVLIDDVTISGAKYLGLGIYASAFNGGTVDQNVVINNTRVSNTYDGVIVDAYSYGGSVTQRVTANDLTIEDNADMGLQLRAEASRQTVVSGGGEGGYVYTTYEGITAQYVSLNNTTIARNGTTVIIGGEGGYTYSYGGGLSASAIAFDYGTVRQDVTLTNSTISDNIYGADFFAAATGIASSQQNVVLDNVTISGNTYGAAANFDAEAVFGGFAEQNIGIYNSNLSYAAEEALRVTGLGLYGGSTEQTLHAYYDNFSHSGADNVFIGAEAYGFLYPTNTPGYAYYSHVGQVSLIGYSDMSHGGGNGLAADSYAGRLAEASQYTYAFGSDLSENARNGVLVTAKQTPAALLYSNLGVYDSNVSHNGYDGIRVESVAYGTNYQPTYGYLIQSITVSGSDVTDNGHAGFFDMASALGIYSFNQQTVTLANSHFDHNQYGAYIGVQQVYGLYSFGAAIQNVTIQGSSFNDNALTGLVAKAESSDVQGRAELHFNIVSSEFNSNGQYGMEVQLSAHDGVYYPGFDCSQVQGLYGGCAFTRTTFNIFYSLFNDNGADGLRITNVADNYGASYTRSGRPLGTPSILTVYSNFDNNGGDGVHIENAAHGSSYIYQYVYDYGSSFSGNTGSGFTSMSDADSGSLILQKTAFVYSVADGNGADGINVQAAANGATILNLVSLNAVGASGNVGNGFSTGATAIDTGGLYQSIVSQYVLVSDSTFSGNGMNGAVVSSLAFGANGSAYQYLSVSGSQFQGNTESGLVASTIALGAGSSNLVAKIIDSDASNNTANGFDFESFGALQGFASQTINLNASYVPNPEEEGAYIAYGNTANGNGGDGLYAAATGALGGAAEQSLFSYYTTTNDNGLNGVELAATAVGYTYNAGTYYYSHASQVVLGYHNTATGNIGIIDELDGQQQGNGIYVRNYVADYAQVDSFAYFGYATLDNNLGSGLYSNSLVVHPSNVYQTGLNTTLDLFYSSASHNGLQGVGVYSNGIGPAYMIQHLTVAGVTAAYNGVAGALVQTHAEGLYGLNLQYVTLANSHFDHNGRAGAGFDVYQNYGPGSFGAAIQRISINGDSFDNNGEWGLAAFAEATGRQGRAEQNISMQYSSFNNNGSDGVYLYRNAHDGVNTGIPCTSAANSGAGGCAFVRQRVDFVYSEATGNGGNGIYEVSLADNFGALYTQGGRAHLTTLLIYGSNISGNDGSGVALYNSVDNSSYLYQFVYAGGSTIDNNGVSGIAGASYVAGASSMLQRVLVYSYAAPMSVSHNGFNGIGLATISDGAFAFTKVQAYGATFTGNDYAGIGLLNVGATGVSVGAMYVYSNSFDGNYVGVGARANGPGAYQYNFVGDNTFTGNHFGIAGDAINGSFQYWDLHYGNTHSGNFADYAFTADGTSTQIVQY